MSNGLGLWSTENFTSNFPLKIKKISFIFYRIVFEIKKEQSWLEMFKKLNKNLHKVNVNP